MAVPAIELRPRGPLALFDAAIRLCARTSDLWAITLVPGALVVGAFLSWVDAVKHVRPLLIPTVLLTFAWLIRALGQGAACHYLDRQLLSNEPPTAWGSFRAALGRAPSLFITAAYNLVFNAITLPFTFFLALIFLSSHVVSYAVTMQGKGHPLALYGTCAKLLGKARGNTNIVRLLFGAQFLVMVNLHVAALTLLYAGRELLGLDVAFVQRFVSLDNTVWVATCVAVGYVIFEPLRAACSTLLLIDGSVRQDGLDLLAIIEQLPKRRSAAKPSVAAMVLAIASALLFGTPARAQNADSTPEGLRARIWAAGNGCGMKGEAFREQLSAVEEVAKSEPGWVRELAEEVDALAEEGDCTRVRAKLDEGLALVMERQEKLRIGALNDLQKPPSERKEQKPAEDDVPGSALRARFWAVGNQCGLRGTKFRKQLDAVEVLSATQHNALSRSLKRAEKHAYEEDDCDTAKRELQQDLAWVEKTVAASQHPNSPVAANKAKEILSRSEFEADGVRAPKVEQPKEEKIPDESPGWWDRFLKWLKGVLDRLFDRNEPEKPISTPTAAFGGGDLFANAMVIALVALVIGVVGYLIYTMRGRRMRSADDGSQVAAMPLSEPSLDENSALSNTPQGWAGLADKFAREGRFREAVRSLYLALLSKLHRDGAIDYDPAKSNWEYFRGFKGPGHWLNPFRELTRRFDYAWYGNDPVGDEGYQQFRTLTEPMLAAEGAPANA